MERFAGLQAEGEVDRTGPFDDVETAVQAGARSSKARSGFRVRVLGTAGERPELRIDARTPSPVLVGSSPVCALRIQDPAVSRRHLALELAHGSLRLRDLGSTNGTRVGGARVLEALLEGGERIEIGATSLEVESETMNAAPELPSETQFGRVLGESAAMRRLYPLCSRLAQTTIPLVIEGETGTGKELLAEALHEAGPRAGGPFVVFDCTAATPNLLESELFGHERGAFTGAVSSRPGVFQQAHGGTLLIDEIGDLAPSLQPKLLRAIERSEVRPLGGARAIRVDVRLIAATRRNLDQEVEHGRFRDDLFHRLAVARIELPPLRRRRDDIAVLARCFWDELSRTADGGEPPSQPPMELLSRWQRDDWPGNVRQLRNAVARALALGDAEAAPRVSAAGGGEAGVRGEWIEQVIQQGLSLPVARERLIQEFERHYLETALARHGSVTRAAQQSGIALRYFQLLRRRRGS